jgi:hypothetical protein
MFRPAETGLPQLKARTLKLEDIAPAWELHGPGGERLVVTI